MNRQKAPDVEEIFSDALQRESPESRAAYLAEACNGDADLRRRVERLLAAQDRAGDFLDSPALGSTVALEAGPALVESPGTVIGPYRLLERIGEGGMGVVYMAEQFAPVRRKVALKVIKPGMDTRQVIARFEAERQALALMDHPNVAHVHDAGATEAGRPYFVMELVRGIPITDYCDRERLPIPARLELFIRVCQAVQHAHQKGIIHRDLKPSNVLVTVIDGVPVPKVIDFGVAKSAGAALTERTLFTGFQQMLGTPMYMSPEQADLSGVDVDTRSDIYSLGILLYELLTGATPFDRETFRKAAYEEIRRIIREQTPPRPSTRLSGLGDSATTVSANRASDPRRLAHTVRGELDWVVMKCLEKDRARRYETANGLAMDLGRYLADQPVEACPPSAWYRFTKYARRHRGTLTAAALVALALVSGMVASLWQAARASAAEQRAIVAKEEAEDHLALGFEAVDTLYEEVANRWQADKVQWGITLPRRFLEKALPFYERFTEAGRVDSATGRAYNRMSQILIMLGRHQEAGKSLDRAEAIWRALLALDPENPNHLWHLAFCVRNQAELPQPWKTRLPTLRSALSLSEQLAGRYPKVVAYQDWLAACHHAIAGWGRERYEPAAWHLDRAREIRERLCAEHPDDPDLLSDLGYIYRVYSEFRSQAGQYADAEPYSRRALAIHDGLHTRYPTIPRYLHQLNSSLGNLGLILVHTQQYEEAARVGGRVAAIDEGLASDYPEIPTLRAGMAGALALKAFGLIQTGEQAEGERIIARLETLGETAKPADSVARLAWFLVQRGVPPVTEPAYAIGLAGRALALDPGSAFAHHVMGVARYRAGQWDEAIAALTRSNELEPDRRPDFNGFFLAMAYHRKGDADQARAWYDRAASRMTDQPDKLPNPDMVRYRAEAAELLAVEDPRAKNQP
jgi:serine/threonine protein kinase